MITLNGFPITPTIFPDKTSQIWGVSSIIIDGKNEIIYKHENDAELFYLLQLSQMLYYMKVVHEIHFPTLPYQRQDKPIKFDNSTFALSSFIILLQQMNCKKTAYDIHNPLATDGYITNILPYDLPIYVENATPNYNTIVFPDKGALHRYSNMFKGIPFKFNAIDKGYFEKNRDPATGEITGMQFISPDKFELGDILICDDLGDGMNTFIKLYPLLKSRSNNIDLHLSHIIQPDRIKVLHELGYRKILLRGQEVTC